MTGPDVAKLLYIGSVGRSGSTLLEILLDAQPGIDSLGELHLWPHELKADPPQSDGRLPCSCGLAVDTCDFWRQMLDLVDAQVLAASPLHLFRERHQGGKTLRISRLRDFSTRPASPSVASAISAYGRATANVMSAYAAVSRAKGNPEPTWLVDSSKDPYRLAWLVRSKAMDLRVIQLVRSPFGFVNSELNNKPPTRQHRARLALRKAMVWNVHNELLLRTRRSLPPGASTLVRYEDLAQDTESVLKATADRLGLPFDGRSIDDFWRRAQSHALGGNPMRHRRQGIRLDERWRQQLSEQERRVIALSTTGWRRRFGY